MNIKLYNNFSDDNTLNKNISLITEIEAKIRHDIDVTNPELILKLDDIDDINYVYLEGLERYYFINDIHMINVNVYRLFLECDVLETYKNVILNHSVLVRREIKEGDYLDVSIDSKTIREVDNIESNVTLEEDNKMILSTISGVI